jgi:hypothetical protein
MRVGYVPIHARVHMERAEPSIELAEGPRRELPVLAIPRDVGAPHESRRVRVETTAMSPRHNQSATTLAS